MRILRASVAVALFAAALSSLAPVQSAEEKTTATDSSNVHGFDFEFGTFRVHHRVKRASAGDLWLEFDGTCTTRPLMAGSGNVEEHTFNKPNGVSYGVALRAYDSKKGEWAIWWVDSRDPHGALDPPMKGRFEKGVGAFYSDYVYQGKPMRTRGLWSGITPTSARWEQASSADAGATWETNWTMDFQRISP
jgi:hypothetical protein